MAKREVSIYKLTWGLVLFRYRIKSTFCGWCSYMNSPRLLLWHSNIVFAISLHKTLKEVTQGFVKVKGRVYIPLAPSFLLLSFILSCSFMPSGPLLTCSQFTPFDPNQPSLLPIFSLESFLEKWKKKKSTSIY